MASNPKALFTIMAVAEAATGLLLLAAPSVLIELLLGTALDGPAGATVARVAGIALLSIGVLCWLARNPAQEGAAWAGRSHARL